MLRLFFTLAIRFDELKKQNAHIFFCCFF